MLLKFDCQTDVNDQNFDRQLMLQKILNPCKYRDNPIRVNQFYQSSA